MTVGTRSSRALMLVVLASALVGCRGDGTFLSSILSDGGGGIGGFGGFGGGFPIDAGMDSSSCTACGPGCFDCGTGCICGEPDSGIEPGLPWASPFPNMGAPGFRNSTETLCASIGSAAGGTNNVNVWSDARGVFVVVSDDMAQPIAPDAGPAAQCRFDTACRRARVLHHAGEGWENVTPPWTLEDTAANDIPQLTGVPGDTTLLYGTTKAVDESTFCVLADIERGQCESEGNEVVTFAVVADATHGYALQRDGALLVFFGSSWQPDSRSLTQPVTGLWADSSVAFAVGDGVLYRLDSNEWTQQATPFDQATALWGRDANRLWVGTEHGAIWLFDGQAWQQMGSIGGSTCSTDNRVRGIWGSGDTVYFYGGRSLMRWNGSGLENLATWACAPTFANTTIQDLWGNSADEVFIALRVEGALADTCGGSVVLRFDGTQFHRM